MSWLRQILAANLAMLVRRYCGTQRRDVRLERELEGELDASSRALDLGLVASGSPSPLQSLPVGLPQRLNMASLLKSNLSGR